MTATLKWANQLSPSALKQFFSSYKSRCCDLQPREGWRLQQRTFASAAATDVGVTQAASRKPRRWLMRLSVTTAAGAAIGLAVASGGDPAHARALAAAMPRTGNALVWVGRAMYEYASCNAAFPERSGPAFEAALNLTHQRCAERLLRLCQANGSLYIKAAQFATTVPAVPQPYRQTLEKLQDRAEPRPFGEIDDVLQREFSATAMELFAEFEPEATAAASLAQVHKARLLTGEEVAVKVQYAGLESAVAADLATFSGLATLAALVFPDFQLGWIVRDLQQTIALELDFGKEAQNARSLSDYLITAGRDDVKVPAVYDRLSNRHIITMEWASGVKVTDREGLKRLGIRPIEVGQLLLRTFADMAFVRGSIHGDPHPGNLLVRPHQARQGWLVRLLTGSTARPQLVILDHGNVIHLPDGLRQKYCQLWCSFVLNDTATAQKISNEIGGQRIAALLPLLLRPGALGKMPKVQRERLRRDTGVKNLGDVGQLLELLPRPLAQMLRVSAVVRLTADNLGCTVADRLRINGCAAVKGMSIRRGPDTEAEFIGDLRSRRKRFELWCRIYLLRWLAWSSHTWQLLTMRSAVS